MKWKHFLVQSYMGRIGTQVYTLLVDLADSAAQSTTLAHSLANHSIFPHIRTFREVKSPPSLTLSLRA